MRWLVRKGKEVGEKVERLVERDPGRMRGLDTVEYVAGWQDHNEKGEMRQMTMLSCR